jgi:hypothetical protein
MAATPRHQRPFLERALKTVMTIVGRLREDVAARGLVPAETKLV